LKKRKKIRLSDQKKSGMGILPGADSVPLSCHRKRKGWVLQTQAEILFGHRLKEREDANQDAAVVSDHSGGKKKHSGTISRTANSVLRKRVSPRTSNRGTLESISTVKRRLGRMRGEEKKGRGWGRKRLFHLCGGKQKTPEVGEPARHCSLERSGPIRGAGGRGERTYGRDGGI